MYSGRPDLIERVIGGNLSLKRAGRLSRLPQRS
jgi:hypothetical protein